MNVLHQALEEATARLPQLVLQNLISKKLQAHGIKAPKRLSHEIAEHFLAGNREPFKCRGRKLPKDVTLTFTENDAEAAASVSSDFFVVYARFVSMSSK